MRPPIRPGCFAAGAPPPVLLPEEEDGCRGEEDCRGVLRGVCLPVVPRVAVGDSERVPEVPLEGVPDAVFPDFAAGSVALAEGDAALVGGCEGCC